MTCQITIKYLNDTFCVIDAKEISIAQELYDYFTFEVPGAKFTPAFRNKMWDGKIHLFNYYNQQLYVGLVHHVLEFATSRKYDICIEQKILDNKPKISYSDAKEYLDSLNISSRGVKISPHDHQIMAFQHAIVNERCLLVSPTASGKSLIIYGLCRKYLDEKYGKILIVVPSISLVTQLRNDFADYAHNWSVDENVQEIMEGKSKEITKNITISTYQSIYKMPKEWFAQFSSVVIDECLSGNTKVLTPNGEIEIQHLKIGDLIINIDPSGKSKIDKIINIHKNLLNSHSEKMYRLYFDNGIQLEVTGNHKVLTKNRGWIRADELNFTDEIQCPE